MGEMILDEPKSAIKHEGNYFIMDSEQLVCNPFQDLQSEVMSDAQKKASLTEKLTSVKNNVCENHFAMERQQMEKDKGYILKKLQHGSSKLRYEVKLLDLDRQKHRIEVKKRVMPERDYSYDETQISNAEKRLGANIACFYLERRMKYPTRLKSVSDISITPLVSKARQALKEQAEFKTTDDHTRSERAQTAKSASSTNSNRGGAGGVGGVEVGAASPTRIPPSKYNRRNSRSAPLVSRSYTSYPAAREDTRLPAIADGQQLRDGGAGGGGKPTHVKFMFEDPLQILMTKDKDSDDSTSLLSRAYTYHPGMGHDRDRFHSRDFFLETSDDEDDPYLPDHIDLRALLFDRQGRRDEAAVSTKSLVHGNNVPTPILRRSNMYAPKITQELIQQENDHVQVKVNRFLQELNEPLRHDDADSEPEDDMFSRLHAPPQVPRPATFHHVPPLQPPSKQASQSTGTFNTTMESDDISQGTCAGRRQKLEENKTPRIPKDAWKYIKGRHHDGSLRGTYTAEDLVLQTLTGVPLSRSVTSGIPLHSAGRAMRHTATFKMRKVVERLIHDRTKYQQHEIEEIKRKMSTGMDLATAAASISAANVNVGEWNQSRNQSRMDPLRPISQGIQS